jgi:hypothetical protein
MKVIGNWDSEKYTDKKCNVDGVIKEILNDKGGHKYQQRNK